MTAVQKTLVFEAFPKCLSVLARQRFFRCFGCDGLFETGLHGQTPVHCDECNQHKYKAQRIARAVMMAAITAGKLPRARGQDCVDCGEPANGYDHRDYDKPLDVVPTCRSCNTLRGSAKFSVSK